MKFILVYLLLAIILACIVAVGIYTMYIKSAIHRQYQPQPVIYCIMITGKDDDRIEFARQSFDNFVEQSYTSKRLIIINHHPTKRVLSSTEADAHEVFVQKTESISLGHLRNIALQLVPINAYWTTWDDDDYRHPDYLDVLASHLTSCERSPTVVAISNRLEYNRNNGSSWVCTKTDGMIFFLAPFDNRISYLDKDAMEDVNMLADYASNGYKVKILDNDPKLYIRIIHKTNTSLYVRPNRAQLMKGPNYSERFTTEEEKAYIHKRLGISSG